MPAIVEFPTLVEAAVKEFGTVFANELERRHFAEYLTGLLVAERKTVSGINREFAVTTAQSCLNRWITEVDWDAPRLNEKRLAWLQGEPTTRYAAPGVIAIDNTLVSHEGQLIEDGGWFWDHAEQRPLIAHGYRIANYVCPSGKHSALEFRRFRQQQACAPPPPPAPAVQPERGETEGQEPQRLPFKTHTELCQEVVDGVVERAIPGDFTFDCYFTNAAILNHMQGKSRGYVGDLKCNRKGWFQGRELTARAVAAAIPVESRNPVVLGDHKQWYFTQTIHIPEVDHAVRIVIRWDRKKGKAAVKILVTNRM